MNTIRFEDQDKMVALGVDWDELAAKLAEKLDRSMAALLSMCADRTWTGKVKTRKGWVANFRVASKDGRHAIYADVLRDGVTSSNVGAWNDMDTDEKLRALAGATKHLRGLFEETKK